MYCSRCGAKNDDDSRFCVICGTRFDPDHNTYDPAMEESSFGDDLSQSSSSARAAGLSNPIITEKRLALVGIVILLFVFPALILLIGHFGESSVRHPTASSNSKTTNGDELQGKLSLPFERMPSDDATLATGSAKASEPIGSAGATQASSESGAALDFKGRDCSKVKRFAVLVSEDKEQGLDEDAVAWRFDDTFLKALVKRVYSLDGSPASNGELLYRECRHSHKTNGGSAPTSGTQLHTEQHPSAASDDSNQLHDPADCGFNLEQGQIYLGLSFTTQMTLSHAPCATEAKVLDDLSSVPPEYRDQMFAKMLDAAAKRRR